MFGRIAPRYDLMNHLMTAGLDRGWRRLAAAEAALAPGDRALDVCCGTGDLCLCARDRWPGCVVTGLDFTAEMLAVAREKAAARGADLTGGPSAADGVARAVPTFVRGDLLALPFADGEFAAVTVGWGVRNVPDLPRALTEMARVTRPGGRVVCLESTRPPEGLGPALPQVWFDRLVPALGRSSPARAAPTSTCRPRCRTSPTPRPRGPHGRGRPRARALPALRLRRRGPARRGARAGRRA